MSLTNVKPYFRTVLKELGHREWKDAFNDENIPGTVLNRSYHLKLGDSSPIGTQDSNLIKISQPITIKLYVKGYRNVNEGVDTAVEYAEAIIKKALGDVRRSTSYTGIMNVTFGGKTQNELSTDNDNVIKVELNFNCVVLLAPTT